MIKKKRLEKYKETMQKGIKLHQLTSSKTSAILLTNSSGRCLKVGTLKQKEETDQVTSVLCRVQDTAAETSGGLLFSYSFKPSPN